MNKKAFLLTNLMLMKWVGGIALHVLLTYFITIYATIPRGGFDAEAFTLVLIVALPGFYMFAFMICLLFHWCIIEPIRNYYIKKCKENS